MNQIRDFKLPKKLGSSDILSAIIHDLKTPLNAVACFADLLKEEIDCDKVSKEELLDYISEIRSAASEMNELVHDILDLNSLGSHGFSVDLSKQINIADVVKRSVKVNYGYGLRRKITIQTIIDEDVLNIRLDQKRVKQILSNIISNAIKYSPENTTIKVVCCNLAPHPLMVDRKPNPEFLEISVIDQGFGMTEDQVRLAFEKYQTIQNPNSGKVDSFGLGLSIVKELVEAQNGIIEVISQPNKGTTFKIKFPYLM